MTIINTHERRDLINISIIGVALGILIQPILTNNVSSLILDWNLRIGSFFLFVLISILGLAIARLISYLWAPIYQFAKFGAVGVLNSVIDIGVFNLETFLAGSSVIGLALFATFKAISFLCSTTNSFFWNRSWTFSESKATDAKHIGSFYAIALIGWAVNVGVATFVQSIGPGAMSSNAHLWTNLVAPVAGILASFVLNFFGYKYFVFKRRGKKS